MVSRRAGPAPGDRASTPSLPRLRQRAVLSRPPRRGWGRPRRASRTAADLQSIPLLTRDEAQESTARRKSSAPPFISIKKRTSGSTGQPLEFGYEADSEAWRQAIRMRGYGWAGYRQGDRTLHLWSDPPRTRHRRWWRRLVASRVGRDRSRAAARGLRGLDRPLGGALGAHRRADSSQAPAHDRLLRPGGGRAGAPRGRRAARAIGRRFRSSAERSRCFPATGRSSRRLSDRPCSRPTGIGR